MDKSPSVCRFLRRATIAALSALVFSSVANAQAPYMVADVGTVVSDWGPFFDYVAEPVVAGDVLYFTHDDGIHGSELWRSDGSGLGTFLLRDICPGSCGTSFRSQPSRTRLGNRLIFSANDGVHGIELWITDGTALGTYRIADLTPGFDSSVPRAMVTSADQVFFVAAVDGTSHLFRTDGTSKGTYSIDPPEGGPLGPDQVYAGPEFLFLCNAGADPQRGLWRSDGTASGTTFVAPVECDRGFGGKANAGTVGTGGVLYFSGSPRGTSNRELWRSDGTTIGTYLLKEIQSGDQGSSPAGFAWRDGELLFRTSSASQLWRSDGSAAGTLPIPIPAETGLLPVDLSVVSGSNYYFGAQDLTHGAEPWVYDGATAHRLFDLAPGPTSSLPGSVSSGGFFSVVETDLLFTADDSKSGLEVWRSNGSLAGTEALSDLSDLEHATRFGFRWGIYETALQGRSLVFDSRTDTGQRLWRLSSSGGSLELLRSIDDQRSAFQVLGADRYSLFDSVRGKICFAAIGNRLAFDYWRNDPGWGAWNLDLRVSSGERGSAEDLFPEIENTLSTCASQNGSLLYGRPGATPSSWDIVALDPVSASSEMLWTMNSSQRSDPLFRQVGATTAFAVDDSLVETGGTASETSVRATLPPDGIFSLDPLAGEIVLSGGSVWRTDAGEPATLLNLIPPKSSAFVEPGIAILGDHFLFIASDKSHGAEIWISEGSVESTSLVKDARPGVDSLLERSLLDHYFELLKPRVVSAGEYAVFAGVTDFEGSELWVSDGTASGTRLLKDIYPGDYPSTPRNLTRFGHRVFFTAESEVEGLELWATDGTLAGTTIVKDIAPSAASSIPDDLVVRDGVLYFSAWSPSYGREAWTSDGTSAGTVRITDIAPGTASSSPQRFARAGNKLFFSATDQVHGYELWAIAYDAGTPLFVDGFEIGSILRWSDSAP